MSVRHRASRRPDPFAVAPGPAFRRDRPAIVWVTPTLLPNVRATVRVVGYDASEPGMPPAWLRALEKRP